MLPLLRVNLWHVTKPRFIQCLLGGRKAPHSKALQHFVMFFTMLHRQLVTHFHYNDMPFEDELKAGIIYIYIFLFL
jgi:hypothetical protein